MSAPGTIERPAHARAVEAPQVAPAARRRRLSRPLLALGWAAVLGAGFLVGPLLSWRQTFGVVVEPAAPIEAAPPTTLVEPEVVRRVQQLVKERRWVEARLQGIDCVRTNPTLAQCHKLLGTAYVKLGDEELGTEEFRTFLQLAPNHPDAQKVRDTVDAFEHKAE